MDTNIAYDGSTHCRHGDIHGGMIRGGDDTRNYRQVLHLNNDVRGNLEAETTQHIKVRKGDSYIETDAATISFWIRPTGISKENAGIVFNNTDDGFTHGIVLSVNGNAYSLGYNWKNQKTAHNVDLRTYLQHDKWSFVVVLIYPSGIVRLFLDNVYVKYYDLGVRHEVVTFDKLEIGRFSGMIDDVRFYSDTLYYGNIEFESQAQSYVRALYETSRVPVIFEEDTPRGKTKRSEFDFYYKQSREFLDAHGEYTRLGGVYNSIEEQLKQQFVSGDPTTQTKRIYAANDFTAIAGNLTGRFVEM